MSALPIPFRIVEDARDRRSGDRRAQSRPLERSFDPLFAATLINQIAPAEAQRPLGYQASRGPRAGIAFNLSA